MRRRRRTGAALRSGLAVALLATAAAACTTTEDPPPSDRIVVTASWNATDSADEMNKFLAVLDAFTDETGIPVTYAAPPNRDAFSPSLDTAISGGHPPDVALLPQPGQLRRYAQCPGVLVPLPDDVQRTAIQNYRQKTLELGTVDNRLYGVVFKAANKSLIWYTPDAFQTANVAPPQNWPEFLAASRKLHDLGLAPLAIGGKDQWVLTDWFENVYLRQAGAKKYDDLAQHKISWKDPSVRAALQTVLGYWNTPGFLAGDPTRLTWQQSVQQVFQYQAAAMVFEGDFLTGPVANLVDTSRLGDTARIFKFPQINNSPESVVIGGDTAVMTRNTTGAARLMQYLASPRSAAIWARQGGLVSPNTRLGSDVYPDVISRQSAQALTEPNAEVKFDLSDQLPPALGGTEGQGLRAALADLLKNPGNLATWQSRLDLIAAAAGSRPADCPGR